MISATVYLTLGAELADMTTGNRQKLYILSVAALLSAMVGVGRVYLGVHWPSCVLPGWAAGDAWVSHSTDCARRYGRNPAFEPI
jgi:undecaprenyl-diphosphatase